MPKEEKTTFFQTCQDLLVKNQPESEFILRKGDDEMRKYYLDLFLKYKGFIYTSDNIAMMYNMHRYANLMEARDKYKEKIYSPPDTNPNTYSIDFVTSVLNAEILEEVLPVLLKRELQHICFLRSGKVVFLPFKKAMSTLIRKFI